MSNDDQGSLYYVKAITRSAGEIENFYDDTSGAWDHPIMHGMNGPNWDWYFRKTQGGTVMPRDGPLIPPDSIWKVEAKEFLSGKEEAAHYKRKKPEEPWCMTDGWDRPNSEAEWRQTFPPIHSTKNIKPEATEGTVGSESRVTEKDHELHGTGSTETEDTIHTAANPKATTAPPGSGVLPERSETLDHSSDGTIETQANPKRPDEDYDFIETAETVTTSSLSNANGQASNGRNASGSGVRELFRRWRNPK